MSSVKSRYNSAKEKYKEIGINTDEALDKLESIAFLLKCCDVVDIAAINDTSDYKSDQENSPKLRQALEKAFVLIPGRHRIALNAVHMDSIDFSEMNELDCKDYEIWMQWVKINASGMDFYTSMVRHEKADKGFSISNKDEKIRNFWIEHCKRVRSIGECIGRELNDVCLVTININDFFMSLPVDGTYNQEILFNSLNEIYSEKTDNKYVKDSLFTGLEDLRGDYISAADETFCQNYSLKKNMSVNINSNNLCDEKHIFHKLNSLLLFTDEIIINVRPEQGNHNMILFNDKLINIARFIINNNLEKKVKICMDFRTDAEDKLKIKKWVIGTRSMQKAFLFALLEPDEILKKCDETKDYNSKRALLEEFKTYPFGAVWDYFCHAMNVPVGLEWMDSNNQLV